MRKNSIKKINCFGSSVLHIPHNSFPYQNLGWKVQVNMVISQELKILYGESNKIKDEKKCFLF